MIKKSPKGCLLVFLACLFASARGEWLGPYGREERQPEIEQ